jgi:amidohydrolase
MTQTMSYLNEAKLLQEEIVTLRRHIHANPELSFAEHQTSALCADKLKALGYTVRTGVGKTGVVADLTNGTGPIIAIRADMDGLPINETNDVPYRSKNSNAMHACGHDAHVSCALACAKILAKEKLPGTIRFIMQPAEEHGDAEGKSGAFRMIEDGAMEGVSAVIGLHMDSSLPAGQIGIIPGPIMAAADIFRTTIKGKGGHGAYPETTIDPVVIASQVIMAIQQIVSRRISALEPAVVTVGSVHSSSERGNVISEDVVLLGTIRSFNQEVREKLISELERACSIAKALGGDYTIEYELGYPPTVNNVEITNVMTKAAADLIGTENVVAIPPKTWSEDFSMLANVAPGAFMFLGGLIKDSPRAHHSPTFDIDESGLYIGPAVLAETARRLLLSLNK